MLDLDPSSEGTDSPRTIPELLLGPQRFPKRTGRWGVLPSSGLPASCCVPAGVAAVQGCGCPVFGASRPPYHLALPGCQWGSGLVTWFLLSLTNVGMLGELHCAAPAPRPQTLCPSCPGAGFRWTQTEWGCWPEHRRLRRRCRTHCEKSPCQRRQPLVCYLSARAFLSLLSRGRAVVLPRVDLLGSWFWI